MGSCAGFAADSMHLLASTANASQWSQRFWDAGCDAECLWGVQVKAKVCMQWCETNLSTRQAQERVIQFPALSVHSRPKIEAQTQSFQNLRVSSIHLQPLCLLLDTPMSSLFCLMRIPGYDPCFPLSEAGAGARIVSIFWGSESRF